MKDKESIEKVKWNIEQWKAVSKRGELEEYKLIEEDIEIMELAVNIIDKLKAEIEGLNFDKGILTDTINMQTEEIEKQKVEIKFQKDINNMEKKRDKQAEKSLKGIINKQNKELEELKAKLEYKQYNNLDNIEFEKYIEKIVKERTEKLYKEIETLKRLEKEDIRKDKIINEMAEFIDKITEEIAREKGVEDFDFCDNKCTYKDEYIGCKQCIIEYFENKVKGSK